MEPKLITSCIRRVKRIVTAQAAQCCSCQFPIEDKFGKYEGYRPHNNWELHRQVHSDPNFALYLECTGCGYGLARKYWKDVDGKFVDYEIPAEETKYTPGKWEIVDTLGVDIKSGAVYIAGIHNQDKKIEGKRVSEDGAYDTSETIANARLIAASPELLKALKEVRKHIKNAEYELSPDKHLLKVCEKAIANAEGENTLEAPKADSADMPLTLDSVKEDAPIDVAKCETKGEWVAKNEISMDDLMRGVNINTKQELASGRVLYSKYCINKVMPKTVDVTTITHIDYGTERADRSYRSNKDMLVRTINYEGIVDMYLPKENKS